jgi:hypothetical protein
MTKLLTMALLVATLALVTGCSNKPENLDTSKISASATFQPNGFSNQRLLTFLPFNVEKVSGEDGEYTVTMEYTFNSGEYTYKTTEMVPYKKSGNQFSPTWSHHWKAIMLSDEDAAKLSGDYTDTCKVLSISKK